MPKQSKKDHDYNHQGVRPYLAKSIMIIEHDRMPAKFRPREETKQWVPKEEKANLQ